MELEFRVHRVIPTETSVRNYVHVEAIPHAVDAFGGWFAPSRVDVPIERIQTDPIEAVRWVAEQLQDTVHVSSGYIFEAMCRNQDIQREFRLPQPKQLITSWDALTNRFIIQLRFTDGRKLGCTLDAEMTAYAQPGQINEQLALDLARQSGCDAHIIFDALQRSVRWNRSVVPNIPSQWRYADRHLILFEQRNGDTYYRVADEASWETERRITFRPALQPLLDDETLQRSQAQLGDVFRRNIDREIFAAMGLSENDLKPDPNKKEADDRAKQLLLDHLSEEQKKTFEKEGWFECVGNKTGKTYRVHNYRNVNTVQGKTKYCLVQKNTVPLPDQLLTEKMLIENDEEKFLKVANRFDTDGAGPITGNLDRVTFNGIDITDNIRNISIT